MGLNIPIPQNKQTFEMEGVVTENLSNSLFRVHLKNNFYITASLSGNIRRNKIRILVGDEVRVQMSIYDFKKGQIIYRYRKK